MSVDDPLRDAVTALGPFPELQNSSGSRAMSYISKATQTVLSTAPEPRAPSAQERGPLEAGTCRASLPAGMLFPRSVDTREMLQMTKSRAFSRNFCNQRPKEETPCKEETGREFERRTCPCISRAIPGIQSQLGFSFPSPPHADLPGFAHVPLSHIFPLIWHQPGATPQMLLFLNKLAAVMTDPAAGINYSLI